MGLGTWGSASCTDLQFAVATRPGHYTLPLFLPRDASAERGDATVNCLSVCPSVCPSVTIRYRESVTTYVGILRK